MKFTRQATPKGVYIPNSAIKLAGFETGDDLELHVDESAMVLLKKRMTAYELVDAIQHLNSITTELLKHIAGVCGPCDDCCDGCPFDDYEDGEEITLPEYLLEEAGIPENAKLCACVDNETNSVTITAAGHDHDLRDVPRSIAEVFACAGICLGALEEQFIRGDIVYGK